MTLLLYASVITVTP